MTERDKSILEYSEKMCEYCCNFDKEHIGMDCTALCKLTMTLAYAEDYGGNCMFYNVPKEQIIVPPCKVGDKVYVADNGGIREATANEIYFHGGDDWIVLLSFDCDYECENCPFSSWSQEYSGEYSCGGEYGCWDVEYKDFGKTVFFTKEEALKALKERSERE